MIDYEDFFCGLSEEEYEEEGRKHIEFLKKCCLTDEDIIKALECCIDGYCRGCMYGDTDQFHCKDDLMQNALDLINRKNIQVEGLKNERIERIRELTRVVYDKEIAEAKAEAIKDFAERLTDRIMDSIEQSLNNPDGNNYFITDVYTDIDNLVKEMVGE